MNMVLALVLSISVAQDVLPAQGAVQLRIERPAYKAGAPGGVKFTLKNVGSQTVYLFPGSFSAEQGETFVYLPLVPAVALPSPLKTGESNVYTWNKKDNGGKWAAAGSYTIRCSYSRSIGSPQITLSADVALTPTGKLAGSSMFPLSVGNEWVYQSFPSFGNPLGLQETMKVMVKSGLWYKVWNLAGEMRWARLSPSAKPTLNVVSQLYPPTVSKPLFKFKLPLGTVYDVGVGYIQKIKVVGVNETVETPAGTFTGCYRLMVAEFSFLDLGKMIGSFYFAPGVGLVQYSKIMSWGALTYRLKRGTLKGSDGKVYTFGQK